MQEDEYENIRKRASDERDLGIRQVSPAKRQRLSNGQSNGFDATPMDIDDHGHVNGLQIEPNGHAYPSPREVEEPTTPIDLLTTGPTAGYQMRKPHQLTSETTFLSTMDGPLHIVRCDWHPQDSSILAASGTDPLIHFWKMSRNSQNDLSAHVNGASKSSHWTVELEGRSQTQTIAAFSWSPDGKSFVAAVENEENDDVTVNLYSAEGDMQCSFTGPRPPVVELLWNQPGDLVLALAPLDADAAITIHSVMSYNSATVTIPFLNKNPHVIWVGDYDFMVSGDTLHSYHFNSHETSIEMTKKHELPEDHQAYAHIVFDPHTRLVAAATESGEIDVSSFDHQVDQANEA